MIACLRVTVDDVPGSTPDGFGSGEAQTRRYTRRYTRRLREWFTAYLRALPGEPDVLSPSSARCDCILANLAPASFRRRGRLIRLAKYCRWNLI
jgi:hypothetical protein